MKDLNRREFVAAAAVAGAAACLCGLGHESPVLAEATTGPSTQPSTAPSAIDVGPKSSYNADGITSRWMTAPTKIAVIRHDERIYACTTTCTHKGCTIKKADKWTFKCPCHGATYDIDGQPTKRPATVALVRYAISVNSDGRVLVDKSKSFTPDKWDDPASFVDIS